VRAHTPGTEVDAPSRRPDDDLAIARARGEPNGNHELVETVWGDREATERDHAATSDVYKTLVDVRFKLLTFVPTVTAIAVGIVAMHQDPASTDQWLLVGAIGLVATLALVVYEVRNSLLHDCAIHRLKHLEQLLGFRPSSPERPPSGVFGERQSSGPLFGAFMVKHDRALAMIYGVVSGAWVWVVLVGIEARWDVPVVDGDVALVAKVVGPIGAAMLVAEEIARLAGRDRPPAIVYTLERSSPGAIAIDEARKIASALEAAWRLLPTTRELTLKDWLKAIQDEECVARLAHQDRCPKRGKCADCESSASDTVRWMNALGQVEYSQRWYFWLWCPPGRRHDAHERRLFVRRNVRKRGFARGQPVLTWRSGIRYGIVGADETARAQAARGSLHDLRASLERRDGAGAPWASLWELQLRAALLEEATAMEKNQSAALLEEVTAMEKNHAAVSGRAGHRTQG
jgi:hypothetical protein